MSTAAIVSFVIMAAVGIMNFLSFLQEPIYSIETISNSSGMSFFSVSYTTSKSTFP